MFKAIAEILSRITIGWVFIESGYGKFQKLDAVTDYFQSLGIPAAKFQAPMIAVIEVVCGAMILVGFCTRLAAFLLAGTMLVALITARREDIHSVSDLLGMIEFLYLIILATLFAQGARYFAIRPSA